MENRIIRHALKFCLIPSLFLLWTLSPNLGIGDLNEWSLLGLENNQVRTLVIIPDNPNIWIAGTRHIFLEPYSGGILRSTDAGVSWDTVALCGFSVNQIIRSPGESQTIYAATDDGIYRSYDQGDSWLLVTRYGLGPVTSLLSVAVNPLDSLHLLLGTGSPSLGILAASTDYGESWERLQFGNYGGIPFHSDFPQYAYAWTPDNCYISDDHGFSWDPWFYRPPGNYALAPAEHGSRVWHCSDSLRWTDDFGLSWSSAMTGSTGFLSSLVQGVTNDSCITVGTTGGAYLLHDPLGQWTFLNENAPDSTCTLLAVSPDQHTLLARFFEGLWSYTINSNSLSSQVYLEPPSYQIYPNPFNPTTVITFTLSMSSVTNLMIYNIIGQKVTTLFNRECQPGTYKIEWDASEMSSGIYFAHLQSGNHTKTIKMVLLK